jgi:hypothetical protein
LAYHGNAVYFAISIATGWLFSGLGNLAFIFMPLSPDLLSASLPYSEAPRGVHQPSAKPAQTLAMHCARRVGLYSR